VAAASPSVLCWSRQPRYTLPAVAPVHFCNPNACMHAECLCACVGTLFMPSPTVPSASLLQPSSARRLAAFALTVRRCPGPCICISRLLCTETSRFLCTEARMLLGWLSCMAWALCRNRSVSYLCSKAFLDACCRGARVAGVLVHANGFRNTGIKQLTYISLHVQADNPPAICSRHVSVALGGLSPSIALALLASTPSGNSVCRYLIAGYGCPMHAQRTARLLC
jgi:hypothetical protein